MRANLLAGDLVVLDHRYGDMWRCESRSVVSAVRWVDVMVLLASLKHDGRVGIFRREPRSAERLEAELSLRLPTTYPMYELVSKYVTANTAACTYYIVHLYYYTIPSVCTYLSILSYTTPQAR